MKKKQQLQDRNEQQQNAAATSKIKIITSLFLSHYVNTVVVVLWKFFDFENRQRRKIFVKITELIKLQ